MQRHRCVERVQYNSLGYTKYDDSHLIASIRTPYIHFIHTAMNTYIPLTEVAVQHRAVWVNLNGSAEVILRQLESLLAEEDGAQPVPSIVVAIVAENGRSKRCDSFLHVLVVHLQ